MLHRFMIDWLLAKISKHRVNVKQVRSTHVESLHTDILTIANTPLDKVKSVRGKSKGRYADGIM